MIEEPNAVHVRSYVPRTGAAFARRAEVPRVRSRAGYSGGARRGARLTRLLAGESPARGGPSRRLARGGPARILTGGVAQKSKRLSDRLKQGSRPKEFLNCNALP